MREKFYFFDSFRDTINAIEDVVLQAKYMKAIIDYGITGEYDTSDEMVNILMVQTKFTMDRSIELSENKSEKMKGNQNAVKNWEKQLKQTKTDKNRQKQTKQEEEVEEEGEVEREVEEEKRNKNNNHPTDEFDEALVEFKKMRKQIKKPLTEKGEELIRKKLQTWYPNQKDLWIKCLYKSIENSWQGVFELKQEDITGYSPPGKRKLAIVDPNKVLSLDEL